MITVVVRRVVVVLMMLLEQKHVGRPAGGGAGVGGHEGECHGVFVVGAAGDEPFFGLVMFGVSVMSEAVI